MNNFVKTYRTYIDSFLFVLLILGFFAAHTVLSYSIIIPVYFLVGLKIILIDRKFSFEPDYIIIVLIFLFNILVQFLVNFSANTVFYSLAILLGLVIYYAVARLHLDKQFILAFVFFLLVFFLIHPSISDPILQFKSYFHNANSLAGVYLLLFFIVELMGNKYHRLANWIIFLPIYLITIQSRGLFLGVATYFIFLILSRFKLRNLAFAIIMLGLFALLVLYVNPHDNYISKLLDYIHIAHFKIFGSDLTYGAHREEIWQLVVTKNPSPLFGIGFGNSNDFIFGFLKRNVSPHNTYLKLYLEGGWILLVSYIMLFFYILIKSKSHITKSFILAIQVRMFFESGFPYGISLESALLILPYFIEKATLRQKNEENNISHTESSE